MLFSIERLAVLLSFTGLALAVNPVEVNGQGFVVPATNKRFTIIGITYQPGGQSGYNPESDSDTLTDGRACLRDAAIMQSLGINTIRVYNIDPTLNHDECASIFNAVGIHMLIDVNSPLSGESLDRSNPSGSYTRDYLSRTFAVVEAFKDYPNLLGFFAANEVINNIATAEPNPPYIRAIQRDLKNYIARHSSRPIPVGYSAADVREVLQDTWAYFQCSIDGDENDVSRSDFFGLNSYSWCGGEATFDTAGYDDLVSTFGNSSIPVFFSEYGCNEVQPRIFDEVQALYGPEMTSISGGLVYEYSQEESDYGLVEIDEDGTVRLLTDFNNLQGQFNQLDIALIESSDSTMTSVTAPPCSTDLITSSSFSNDFDIPDPPEGVEDLINEGLRDPNRGQIIDIQETEVPFTVLDSEGNAIEGLAIRPLPDNESNTPSGDELEGTRSDSEAPSPSETGAAGRTGMDLAAWAVAAVASFVVFFL